jgi:hypothetical protein
LRFKRDKYFFKKSIDYFWIIKNEIEILQKILGNMKAKSEKEKQFPPKKTANAAPKNSSKKSAKNSDEEDDDLEDDELPLKKGKTSSKKRKDDDDEDDVEIQDDWE